jgi:hypothetical protein
VIVFPQPLFKGHIHLIKISAALLSSAAHHTFEALKATAPGHTPHNGDRMRRGSCLSPTIVKLFLFSKR